MGSVGRRMGENTSMGMLTYAPEKFSLSVYVGASTMVGRKASSKPIIDLEELKLPTKCTWDVRNAKAKQIQES